MASWALWLRAQGSRVRDGWLSLPGVLVGVQTIRGFVNDRCLLRASALTYTTLLAIVPLLAVVLAVLKGAGFADSLRPFLVEQVPVAETAVIDDLLAYIGRANAQAVGGIGLVLLFVSVWTMFGNIEQSLNDILGVRASRGYLRRIGEYLSMLMVGAVVIAASVVLQTLFGSPMLFSSVFGDRLANELSYGVLGLLPWVSVWAGFAFLYTWMPNAHVPFRYALVGGIVGGTLFQLVQLLYIQLQFGFARYNAIYGALAQLPILLVWVYLSWALVLFGAEVISALRSRTPGPGGTRGTGPGRALGLEILTLVLDDFRQGRATPRPDQIAGRLEIDSERVRAALEPLLRAGILVEPSGEQGLLPASSPSKLSLERVLDALDGGAGSSPAG